MSPTTASAPPSPAAAPETRPDAQRRANRIRAFQEELDALGRGGVLTLTPEQRDTLTRHHAAELARLRETFDIDSDDAARQMSRGMQAAALLGALAFSAALFSFVYHFWDALTTPWQAGIVAAAPLLLLVAVEYVARRERTQYVASLLAIVACAAVALEMQLLGDLFNMRASAAGLFPIALVSLALGYGYGFRIPYGAGLVVLLLALAGQLASLRGLYWTEGFYADEAVLLMAVSLLGLGLVLHARTLAPARRARLNPILRGVMVAFALFALLSHSINGVTSLLPLDARQVATLYQIAAFPVAVAVMAAGLKRRWTETYVAGVLFLLLFLLSRFVAWWWERLPAYLFFLLLGGMTLGILLALRRARARLLVQAGGGA